MDNQAMFKFSYGLYVLTAKEGDKDNGCIINTAMQVTDTPKQVIIVVNKQNYTHDMIMNTKEFNISMLDHRTDFEVFKRFGFQSGRSADKFEGIEKTRSDNGITYINTSSNAYISGKVTSTVDLGTHTMFIAEAIDAKVLSKEESVTYNYYQSDIKPKPTQEVKKGYRCKICGYVYEGDPLPEDYICPLCKHGADDFEKIV